MSERAVVRELEVLADSLKQPWSVSYAVIPDG